MRVLGCSQLAQEICMQGQDSNWILSVPDLLKYILEVFRDIGGNLNFIQVLFLLETVSSSTTILVYVRS